jgi:hypothetical protein
MFDNLLRAKMEFALRVFSAFPPRMRQIFTQPGELILHTFNDSKTLSKSCAGNCGRQMQSASFGRGFAYATKIRHKQIIHNGNSSIECYKYIRAEVHLLNRPYLDDELPRQC